MPIESEMFGRLAYPAKALLAIFPSSGESRKCRGGRNAVDAPPPACPYQLGWWPRSNFWRFVLIQPGPVSLSAGNQALTRPAAPEAALASLNAHQTFEESPPPGDGSNAPVLKFQPSAAVLESVLFTQSSTVGKVLSPPAQPVCHLLRPAHPSVFIVQSRAALPMKSVSKP